jgi:alpha-amylase
MKNICFYFQIHQPISLKRYRFFEIGQDHYYYDDFQTEHQIRKLVEQAYLPSNKVISEMIRSSNGKFKCAFSISGIALEQLEQYAPEVIDSFKELGKTGSVEFLTEPYAHSLSSIFNATEFELQVKKHAHLIETLFGKKPTAFRNSEMIYNDEIGEIVSNLGYKTILIDEARQVFGWKSPNYIYNHSYLPKVKLLVRNNRLSDDIAFRFSNRQWDAFPLTADKFISWINNLPDNENLINLWMGYEALGIYQRAETGIYDFFKALPFNAIEQKVSFVLPTEISKKMESAGAINAPYPISWYGNEKDVSSWTGNDLQQEALYKLYAVSERVHLCSDRPLQHDWLMLQSTDHFRYMSHKSSFGSPFESPYDAFTNYMNILADFLERVDAQYPTTIENEELNELLKTINHQEKEIESLESEIKRLKTRKSSTTDTHSK